MHQCIHKEQHWMKNKFKEATVISQDPGCFSQPSGSGVIRNVWKPLLASCKISFKRTKSERNISTTTGRRQRLSSTPLIREGLLNEHNNKEEIRQEVI